MSRLDCLHGVGLVLADQALVGNVALSLGQPLAGAGTLGHNDGREKAGEDGDKPFKEENVAPRVDGCRIRAPARDTCETGSQKPSKGTGHGGC